MSSSVENVIRRYRYNKIKQLLNHRTAVSFSNSREWALQMTPSAGVYTIFEDENLVYIGESGCIRERMGDLLDTRNHSLRRHLGETLYSNTSGYHKATTKQKYPNNIEKRLNRYMVQHLKIKPVVVPFGRKEIEEAIVETQKPIFNIKSKRRED